MYNNWQTFSFKKSLQVIAAGVLLLVFLLTPLVETFHHHRQYKSNLELTQHAKNANRPQLNTYSFCKICDYLQHAGHHHVNTRPVLYTVYLSAIILKSKVTEPRIVPALILSYANKGPPLV